MKTKRMSTWVAVVAVLAVAGMAKATDFTGVAWGTWYDPVRNPTDPGDIYSIANNDLGGGTASFAWGQAIQGSTDNLFDFDGVGSDGPPLWSIPLGQDFVVGDFSYRNGSTYRATADGILGVNLGVTLNVLSIDANVVAIQKTFDFSFDIINTPNHDPVQPVLDGDIVQVSAGSSLDTFSYQGVDYSLSLVGFSTDGGTTIRTDFSSPEGATAQASVYGRITQRSVPDGGCTLMLLGMALGCLRLLKRK